MSKKNTSKKTTATEQTAEQTKAPAPAASAAVTAAIALCVLVTLPPMEKFEAGKGYWQIEIKDQQGKRYSDVYRVKELEKAHTLAEKIAKDRKLPIVTQEPPAPRTAEAEPAAPVDSTDYDNSGIPF
jgi:hypothetical protein